MKLADLLDVRLLNLHIGNGYVSERYDTGGHFAVYNYTNKASFDGVWDEVTMNCRGLVVSMATADIVSRPYKKFYNWNQPEAAPISMDEPVICSDKLDGSMITISGVDVPNMGPGYLVASRGSLESEQANKALELFMSNYADVVNLKRNYTYMCEVIYPGNRIVLDYGNDEKLVLHGIIDNETGENVIDKLNHGWPDVAQVFPYKTLADALAAPPRKNAEGIVVRAVNTGNMVKIKQDDYIQAHKIVTNLSDKALWEHLRDHSGDYSELIEKVPDEWHEWLRDRADKLILDYRELRDAFVELYSGLRRYGVISNRKAFAAIVMNNTEPMARGVMFSLYDGKDISQQVWKMVKPREDNDGER